VSLPHVALVNLNCDTHTVDVETVNAKNSKTGFLHFNALLNPDPVLHGGYYATGAQVAQFLLAKIFRYPRCVAAFDKLSEVCC
jgi:hypothetical protein